MPEGTLMAADDRGLHVSRRAFVQGTSLAGLGLLAGCGQVPWQVPSQPAAGEPKIPRIGHLGASTNPLVTEALAELDYVEGQSIHIEWRGDEGLAERLTQHVAELVHLNLDLILAAGTSRARVLRDATSTIPIVMHSGVDPVGAGLAESLGHPGGNVTGAVEYHPELPGKQLELLRELVPGITYVSALADPFSFVAVRYEELAVAARLLGLQLRVLLVPSAEALAGTLARAAGEQTDALFVVHSGLMAGQQTEIFEFAAQQRLPAMYGRRTYVEAGGLAAYGPNLRALYHSAAYHVDRILKGTKPADLPIEQPTVFDFVINLKTAQTLGLTIPPHVLLLATEVIR
jgi:putative tryptophan/tyrosine transport system substrate-binding protein